VTTPTLPQHLRNPPPRSYGSKLLLTEQQRSYPDEPIYFTVMWSILTASNQGRGHHVAAPPIPFADDRVTPLFLNCINVEHPLNLVCS
jgi:hypothetical protein